MTTQAKATNNQWRISFARAEARAQQHHQRPPALPPFLRSSLPPAPLTTPSASLQRLFGLPGIIYLEAIYKHRDHTNEPA
jgi:hypothetical protein